MAWAGRALLKTRKGSLVLGQSHIRNSRRWLSVLDLRLAQEARYWIADNHTQLNNCPFSRSGTDRVYMDAFRVLNASSLLPRNRCSATFQFITFQMFSTYAALPFKYCCVYQSWFILHTWERGEEDSWYFRTATCAHSPVGSKRAPTYQLQRWESLRQRQDPGPWW